MGPRLGDGAALTDNGGDGRHREPVATDELQIGIVDRGSPLSASPLPDTSEPMPRFSVAGPLDAADGAVSLVLEGELDLANAPELDRRLRLAEAAGTRVVVDLRSVAFIDSTGLSALVASRERHRERGAAGPALVVVDGQVRRVLELTGCDDMIEDASALG